MLSVLLAALEVAGSISQMGKLRPLPQGPPKASKWQEQRGAQTLSVADATVHGLNHLVGLPSLKHRQPFLASGVKSESENCSVVSSSL